MAKKTESGINKSAIVAGVAGVAAAAARAIGAYWLYGTKNAAKNRKMVKSWMLNARAEVMEAVSKLENVDKEVYHRIVDEVVKKYSEMHADAAPYIAVMAKEMKDAWSLVQKTKKPAKKVSKK